jgi:hypothetical protein
MAKKKSHLSPSNSRRGYLSEPRGSDGRMGKDGRTPAERDGPYEPRNGRPMERAVKREQYSERSGRDNLGVHHDEGSIEEGRRDSMSGAEAGAMLIHSKRYYGAGQGDFANMPREVRMEQYPKDPYGVGIDYADNYDRIQEIEGGSFRNMRDQLSGEMY